MSFSVKIILGEYTKADGQTAIHLQTVMDGNRAHNCAFLFAKSCALLIANYI